MIKHKGGRKPLTVKRVKTVNIKLLRSEHIILQARALQANLKLAILARELALNNELKIISISKEDREVIVNLIKMANNLNQLAKNSYTHNLNDLSTEIKEVLAKINQILSKIQNP